MSDKKLLRWPDVLHITQISRSTVWRMMQRGAFPKQVDVGTHCAVWDAEEINRWVEERKRVSR
ncbi:AlpA family phage regulatory protein [Salmonella enterica]|nr:AlpA family phage regulatory protein [Salmonella enterica]